MQIARATAACDGLVEDGPPFHFFHVLAEVADGQLFRDRNFPFVGIFFAHDHAEEGGLARAIGPYQANLFTGVELEGGVNEDKLPAVLLVNVGKRDHLA